MDVGNIRNFSIIAHIDHGKSTLADRILLLTGAVSEREFQNQILDDMDLERERGITIKAKAVTMEYVVDGVNYLLNLIDTPGHVDFSYEVSRSLAACEGALLLVDASQGVEAQTMANAYLAVQNNLEIIPIINKIDLPNSRPEEVKSELDIMLGIRPQEVLEVSAKTGLGIPELIKAVVQRVPPPKGSPRAPLRALVFDSVYDDYRGVVTFIRIVDGTLRARDKIRFLSNNREYEVEEVGIFTPKQKKRDEMGAGEVGYVVANIKTLSDVKIGDTITHIKTEVEALPGYVEPKHMVFCGLYPTNNSDYANLRKALEKLRLNDSSFTFEPESSDALGLGFRCGFLGLLHMEIVQERLERESNVDLVQTSPTTPYEVVIRGGEVKTLHRPTEMPDPSQIEEIREPIVRVNMVVPSDAIGSIMKLCQDRRGVYKKTEYLSPTRVLIEYELPLNEILHDFYDKLKSATRGYGTMDYEFVCFRADELVRLNILVGGTEVDALSLIVHRDFAEYRGRKLLLQLKKEIPRHQFEVPLQASIGGRVIARENIKAFRKDVLAKCYGGDVSRKRKLLEKQKEGKKRMKNVGNVEIPQKAFMAALSLGEDEARDED